jgi:hypothetical protein
MAIWRPAVSNIASMPARRLGLIRRLDLSVFIVAGIAMAVGFAAAAFVGISDALSGEVRTSLLSVAANSHPGWFVIIDVPPNGVARGIQIGLLCVVLGGVPAAILAAGLAKRRARRDTGWSDRWGNVCLAGLVFQLSRLTLTAFILVLLLSVASDGGADAKEVVSFGGPLLVSIGCSVWRLHSWRALQFGVRQTIPRIVP